MRESQYIEGYLAQTGGGHLATPGAYLASILRGRAKTYGGRYTVALMASLERRIAAGTVRAVPSVGGGVAYIPVTSTAAKEAPQ